MTLPMAKLLESEKTCKRGSDSRKVLNKTSVIIANTHKLLNVFSILRDRMVSTLFFSIDMPELER